jgi:hypothetical protein
MTSKMSGKFLQATLRVLFQTANAEGFDIPQAAVLEIAQAFFQLAKPLHIRAMTRLMRSDQGHDGAQRHG